MISQTYLVLLSKENFNLKILKNLILGTMIGCNFQIKVDGTSNEFMQFIGGTRLEAFDLDNDPRDFENTLFRVQYSLSGDPGYISLESVFNPGSFWTDDGSNVELKVNDGTPGFKKKSSYRIETIPFSDNRVKFQSKINLEFFIVKDANDNKLVIQKIDPSNVNPFIWNIKRVPGSTNLNAINFYTLKHS